MVPLGRPRIHGFTASRTNIPKRSRTSARHASSAGADPLPLMPNAATNNASFTAREVSEFPAQPYWPQVTFSPDPGKAWMGTAFERSIRYAGTEVPIQAPRRADRLGSQHRVTTTRGTKPVMRA